MPTFTDLDPLTVELNSKNCDYLFNSLTSKKSLLAEMLEIKVKEILSSECTDFI